MNKKKAKYYLHLCRSEFELHIEIILRDHFYIFFPNVNRYCDYWIGDCELLNGLIVSTKLRRN